MAVKFELIKVKERNRTPFDAPWSVSQSGTTNFSNISLRGPKNCYTAANSNFESFDSIPIIISLTGLT